MCIFPRILEVSQFFLPIFFNNLKSPFLMASVQSQFSPVGPRLRRGPESRHWATPLESQRARFALVSQLRRHKKARSGPGFYFCSVMGELLSLIMGDYIWLLMVING